MRSVNVNLPTHSLQSERYLQCSITSLGEDALTEIGRVVAHYGLLVARVREFVSYVSSHVQSLPPSIGSKDSIELLPSVFELIKPAFYLDSNGVLERAMNQVTMACETMDRFHYSVWGALPLDPEKVRRTEYRRYKAAGCWCDQSTYSASDVHELAMEISLAMSYLDTVEFALYQKIVEAPHSLRRILNRKQKSADVSNTQSFPQ